jgi:hypothetical protein
VQASIGIRPPLSRLCQQEITEYLVSHSFSHESADEGVVVSTFFVCMLNGQEAARHLGCTSHILQPENNYTNHLEIRDSVNVGLTVWRSTSGSQSVCFSLVHSCFNISSHTVIFICHGSFPRLPLFKLLPRLNVHSLKVALDLKWHTSYVSKTHSLPLSLIRR